MGTMDEMMEAMLGSMSKEDKQEMIGKMMEKFFAGMTAEDKQQMMEQMMGGGQGTGEGTPMMGRMMTNMMPHCISTVLPGLPKNERVEFILKMIGTLMEHGSAGMSQEEKDDLVARALEAITA